ncbi:helix-turn-helix domain-containing protein [Lentzea albidocapillata]|uniref:PucR C-terminal helix-turn-helix domain-containing protein n=1 Tax=Lentzea albidocapillata TaxID=40571 RepID=A0A1W2FBR5_9PSEU|nr:helix-turn-helix domain-containing protein [Lentzea albidocapillata]SMD19385.1 PucR C-terminal helix-turn-helix domain-containing protein [Lentzea albidocapillata]
MIDDAGSLTVRDLLEIGVFGDATLLAGERGVGTEVADVRLAADMTAVEACSAGDLVILTGHQPYLVEVALRRAYSADVRAVVLVRSSTGAYQAPSAATISFANRLGVPLLQADADDPLLVADALRTAVRRPEVAAARLLNAVTARLGRSRPDPRSVITILSGELHVTCAVISADGTAIEGVSPPGLPPELLAGSVAATAEMAEGFAVAVPVETDRTGHVHLWLVSHARGRNKRWAETVLQISQVASWALGSWVAAERLEAERQARSRGSLLSELLASGDDVPPQLVQQAVLAGWRLDGWHTGVYVVPAAPGVLDATGTERLRVELSRRGLHGQLVEGAEGWSFWLTNDSEPPQSQHRELTAKIAQVLGGCQLVAGIGRPHPGVTGVGRTLAEAREAAAMTGSAKVVHVDELGVRRLLSMAAETPALVDQATRLLAPLAGVEDGQLLRTLAVYLDEESVTSSAAVRLKVHRNTVSQRINRVEQLLGVSLLNPDERLAVHLACRAVRASDE